MDVVKLVPYILDVRNSDLSSPLATLPSENVLPYAKCVEAVITGKPMTTSTGKEVSLPQIAPDLSMGSVKLISADEVPLYLVDFIILYIYPLMPVRVHACS